MTPSAQRLLRVLRVYRYRGMPRHLLTVPPTVDHDPSMRDFDEALEELREAGYRVTMRRRRRGGMPVYWLSAEPPSPPTLFDEGADR